MFTRVVHTTLLPRFQGKKNDYFESFSAHSRADFKKNQNRSKKPLLNPRIFEIWDLKNANSRAETFKKGVFPKNDHPRAGNDSNPVFSEKVWIFNEAIWMFNEVVCTTLVNIWKFGSSPKILNCFQMVTHPPFYNLQNLGHHPKGGTKVGGEGVESNTLNN